MLGGNIRLSNNIALVSENWFITGGDFSLGEQPFALALRFFGDRLAADVGAILVGENTRGAANNPEIIKLKHDVQIWLPAGQPINPITKTNWEKKGVVPDIEVKQENALFRAILEAIDNKLNEENSQIIKKMLQFEKGYIQAKFTPLHYDSHQCLELIGKYGSVDILLVDDSLT